MVKCKKCGYEGEYTSQYCPECRALLTFTNDEIKALSESVEYALSARDYALAEECYHILADLGDPRAEREYASILEEGKIVKRNLDSAMKYYSLAAEKNDPHSAYRYSRLLDRTSAEAADFWLTYSTVLGCSEAFPVLAERLSAKGDEAGANYFYSVAAEKDDIDSIVTLASRYYDGIGTEASPEIAKWYMDKLTLPPIHAIKLAYKLRSVKATEPPRPIIDDYDGFLKNLAGKAKAHGFYSALFTLSELLSDRGDLDSLATLGTLYLDGLGTHRDAEKALDALKTAADIGSEKAARALGDAYISGKLGKGDPETALLYYSRAAELGMTNAYEIMGDIYMDGRLVKRSIPEAIRLYSLAANDGHTSARAKAEKLISDREAIFKRGLDLVAKDSAEAFRSFAIATGMGHVDAALELAKCYECGIGAKKDRQSAFIWYKNASECGSDEASYYLGLCYSRGVGTAFSFDKAKEALLIAAKHGIAGAEKELQRIYENKKIHMLRAAYAKAMELIYMKKAKEAIPSLEVCLKLGHTAGIYTLGCLYEFGIGPETDRAYAKELYDKAFDAGFSDARAVHKKRILQMSRS